MIQNWSKPKKVKNAYTILRICKFLLLIYLQLLRYSCFTNLANIEEYFLKLWLTILQSIQYPQKNVCFYSSSYSLDLQHSNNCRNQYFRLCSYSYTIDYNGKKESSSGHIPFLHIQGHRTQLQYIQLKTPHSFWNLLYLVPLLERIRTLYRFYHRL